MYYSTYSVSQSYCNFPVFSGFCLAAVCILFHIGKDQRFFHKDPIWKWSKNCYQKFAFWKEMSLLTLASSPSISPCFMIQCAFYMKSMLFLLILEDSSDDYIQLVMQFCKWKTFSCSMLCFIHWSYSMILHFLGKKSEI